MTHNITIWRMRIILPSLLVAILLLSVDSGCSMLSQETETVIDVQDLDVLNYFCLVIINGSWHRCPLFMHLTFDFFSYYLGRRDFPFLEKIIGSLLDGYMDIQRWMPLKLYHSAALFCQGWDAITTMGFKGVCTAEKSDSYQTLDIILFGFTGLWIQKEKSDFAIGLATCAAIV